SPTCGRFTLGTRIASSSWKTPRSTMTNASASSSSRQAPTCCTFRIRAAARASNRPSSTRCAGSHPPRPRASCGTPATPGLGIPRRRRRRPRKKATPSWPFSVCLGDCRWGRGRTSGVLMW
ncbi:unnamed protein product, partial [Phaeothamnion confervicola]